MPRGLRFKANELKSGTGASTLSALLGEPRKIKEKGMNGIETAFSKILETAQSSGEILRWEFEAVSLKCGPNTKYNPDFLVVLPDGHWVFIETKGFLRDDAAAKFKVAAAKYPEPSFIMIRRNKGAWETIYTLPGKGRKNALDLPLPTKEK